MSAGGAAARRGHGSREQARLVMNQIGDFVFDSKFLALKFGDPEFVGARSVFFFFDPMVQVGMFGLERFDSVQNRSEEHTSELQSLMRISYAVFCLKKKKMITL